MIKLLHLDDDPMMHLKTGTALQENPFGLHLSYDTARNDNEFFTKLQENGPYSCVLLDIMLGNCRVTGLDVLRQVRSQGYTGTIIMFTTMADAPTIATCTEAGATDFVTKGLSEVELAYRVTQAIKTPLKETDPGALDSDLFAGETIRIVKQKLEKVLKSSLKSVLVFGESGTGKEAVGKVLRSLLPKSKPYVAVNCGSLPDELIESEFFGHRKGAFTGAVAAKEGFFAQAHGGWLFLDEIANLSYAAQAALLRVLETGEMRAVGGDSVQHVEVRILAATNVDLDDKVAKGQFRGDLLQRLRNYELLLPPLRERTLSEQEEILNHLIDRLNRNHTLVTQNEQNFFSITIECRKMFLAYRWDKGNIREMWHAIQAASIDAHEGLIKASDLPNYIRKMVAINDSSPSVMQMQTQIIQASTPSSIHTSVISHEGESHEPPPSTLSHLLQLFPTLLRSFEEDLPLEEIMDEVEKVVITTRLKKHPNRESVYKGLQISRSSLNQKKQKYNI